MGSLGASALTVKLHNVNIALEHLKDINPNYNPNASNLDKAGYNNNCVMCALAFEANARGNDVEANNFKFGDVDTLHKSRDIEKAFANADVWDVGRTKRRFVVDTIEYMLTEDWGNGSRGIIQINSGITKHTMNVINDNGKVKIVDAQNGTQGSVAKMLTGLPTQHVKLFRVDNLEINDEYAKWAYKRRK